MANTKLYYNYSGTKGYLHGEYLSYAGTVYQTVEDAAPGQNPSNFPLKFQQPFSSGASSFITLSDTPNSYAGSAYNFPMVDGSETRLEFGNILGATNIVTVDVASTGNLVLSGNQTINGVVNPATVLVWQNTLPAENGAYSTGAGAWTRMTLADTAAELNDEVVFVTGGTLYKKRYFNQIETVVTINVDPVNYQINAIAGNGAAGIYWALAGNTNVQATNKLGSINNRTVRIFTNNTQRGSWDTSGNFNWGTASQFVVGSTGIVTAGVWNGTTVAMGFGGTGNTSFTAGSVVFSSGTILTQDNSKFFWDNTNKRLGIGTTTPSQSIHIFSTTASQAIRVESQLTSGLARIQLVNDGGKIISYSVNGSATANTNPTNIPNSGLIQSTGAGGMVLNTSDAAGTIIFSTAGITNANIRAVIGIAGSFRLNAYGSGTFTGTATKALQVDASGNVIEGTLATLPSGTSTQTLRYNSSNVLIATSDITNNGAGIICIGFGASNNNIGQCIGYQAVNSGNGGVAMCYQANVSATNGIAIGDFAITSGVGGGGFGYIPVVTFARGYAIGYNPKAAAVGAFMFASSTSQQINDLEGSFKFTSQINTAEVLNQQLFLSAYGNLVLNQNVDIRFSNYTTSYDSVANNVWTLANASTASNTIAVTSVSSSGGALFNHASASGSYRTGDRVVTSGFAVYSNQTYYYSAITTTSFKLYTTRVNALTNTSPVAFISTDTGTITPQSRTPITQIDNSFQLYSDDYAAGAASPYFLCEDGVIINLRALNSKVTAGSFSQLGAATTVFTVTIGSTQPNNTYKVNVTPTNLLAAALFYVTNKTTSAFDVTYLAGLTGTVSFDWILAQ